MEKKHTLGLLAILAILSTALFRSPSTEPGRNEPSPTSKENRPTVATRSDEEDPLDTLDVLAESMGVDISTEGLKRRALRSMRALVRDNPDTNLTEEVRFLWTLLQLPIQTDARALKTARAALRAFADTHHIPLASSGNRDRHPARAPIKGAELFLVRFLNQPADSKAIENEFDQFVGSTLKLEVLKQAAADQCIRVRFLIATLPDPVDSYTGWQFDPLLDAISQAVSASDYTLDRFHFPDLDVESAGGERTHARGRAHEDEPTLVIFRKHPHDGAINERLVLQIVHETPTAGVHARAFARAVRLAARWTDDVPDQCGAQDQPDRACVRILGPTFSGTSESIARALQMARTALDGRPVWIVSGSATDPRNEGTFAGASANVRYQATVQQDDVLVGVLMRHIEQAGWSDQMAVLFEGNTQYGRQILEHVHRYPIGGAFSGFRQVPFPMNISRLRTNARSDQPEINRALGLPSKFRPLSMEQQGTPSDQIPPLFPTTTASYLELAVSNMLQSLADQGVRTVALMATDPRDRLYLAQQVARYAPNLSIAVVESEALYAHPDYASYLRGALVASTYPLYGGNQRWSGGVEGAVEQREFANGSAQGIYNAALALLNYDQGGHPLSGLEHVPSLVEYGPPVVGRACSQDCRPPVWISVVGRSGLWPVRPYPSSASSSMVFAVTPPAVVQHAGADAPMLFPSGLFTGLYLFLVAVSGWCWWVVFLRTRHSRVWPLMTNESTRSSLRWGLAGAWAIATFAAALGVALVRVEPTLTAVATAIAPGLTILILADMTRRLLSSRPMGPWRLPRPRAVRAWVKRLVEWRTVLALTMLWGVGNLLAYAWRNALVEPGELIGLMARSTSLGSGVSPLLPVALLAAGVCLWAWAEFLRARTPAAALNDPSVQELIGFGLHGGTAGMSARWSWFDRPLTAVPAKFQTVALVAVVATCVAFDPFFRPLVSVEGPLFGRFVSSTLLVLQVAACLSMVQFGYLWVALRRLLDRLAQHAWSDAYQRVPEELFPSSVIPRAPRLLELHTVVARSRESFALAPAPMSVGVHGSFEGRSLEQLYDEELRSDSKVFWSQSRTWAAILEALLRRCRGSSAPPVPDRLDQDEVLNALARAPESASIKTAALITPVQDLMAMSMAFVIRDAIARLWQNLIFVTGTAVLVFCSHMLFRFQPHRHLEALGWTYIAILFTAVVTVLVQMKNNEIFSRLASPSSEDRRTWDSAFLLKLAMFALIPLLTLFAAQFPDVGGVILRWAEPVQKALP